MTRIVNSMTAFQLNMKTLYDIEKQLERALPYMVDAATDEDLKNSFLSILDETRMHSNRLEQIFEMIDMTPSKHISAGIRGIIEDTSDIIINEPAGPIKDVLLAGAARSLEHFEMVNYMTAIDEADNLGLDGAVDLLQDTLEEEEFADQKFAIVMNEDLKKIEDLDF